MKNETFWVLVIALVFMTGMIFLYLGGRTEKIYEEEIKKEIPHNKLEPVTLVHLKTGVVTTRYIKHSIVELLENNDTITSITTFNDNSDDVYDWSLKYTPKGFVIIDDETSQLYISYIVKL